MCLPGREKIRMSRADEEVIAERMSGMGQRRKGQITQKALRQMAPRTDGRKCAC